MTNNPIFMRTQLLLYFNQELRDSTVYAFFVCLNRLAGALLFVFLETGQKLYNYILKLLQRKSQILKCYFSFE